MAEPIVKWAGGKRQMLDEILPRVPTESQFNRYFEPFVGGGALFFELEPSEAYISDINRRLINFYKQVKQRPEELIGVMSELCHVHSEELYYARRDEFNDLEKNGECSGDRLREAGLFYYLNQTCFNGLYRENEEGEFNVPYGRQKSMPSVEPNRIRNAHEVLQPATIEQHDYLKIEELVTDNDFVYFDPPYQWLSGTAKFSHYNKMGYRSEEQDDLRNLVVRLHNKGAYVVVTNSSTAKTMYTAEKIPDAFRVVNVTGGRAINSDSANRTKAPEIIVTNVSPFELDKGTSINFVDSSI